MTRTVGRLGSLAAVLTIAAGCSSEPQLSQMSGKVTFKGKPVPAGYISFMPEVGSKGEVRVVQIKDGVFDSSKEPNPGIHPGPCVVRIAGFDGNPVRLFPQGKQIFNIYEFKETVAAGTTTKDFTVPDSYGQNVKIEPTADDVRNPDER